MILHAVYLRLNADHDAGALLSAMTDLGQFCAQMPECAGFSHGPNLDLEAKSPDYPYGFIASFTGTDALAAYAADPAHKAIGARLCALCTGGAEGIIVYDLEVAAP